MRLHSQTNLCPVFNHDIQNVFIWITPGLLDNSSHNNYPDTHELRGRKRGTNLLAKIQMLHLRQDECHNGQRKPKAVGIDVIVDGEIVLKQLRMLPYIKNMIH